MHRFSFIVAMIPVFIWFVYQVFPPKRESRWYGYRTKLSVLNDDTWITSNRFSSQLYLPIGIVGIIVAYFSVAAGFRNPSIITAMVCATLMSLIIPITERYLKKHFDAQGNRKI